MDVALAKIQKLYTLESRLKSAPAEQRCAERQAHAKPMPRLAVQHNRDSKSERSHPLQLHGQMYERVGKA